ncbi:tubulin/FtsZ domain-containing protein [Rhizobium sp. N541]|nr:tubulin/FtsZ domain-containing protein [Rhizobium sp. N324]ANM18826.1 tubulin/FtsZ domain-containing protein [Rhizobium sp. N541]ANM25212.1 tubulin/FtsZ domain-containing protein [Rhizobium sp. N941]OYD05959.1 tubulin/FtsZ domain-containing protein [Rhizobium sp. N4311]
MLYAGVSSIVDLVLKEGVVNLDFADVKAIMRDMGLAVMGTGDAAGPGRATTAAKAALENPLFGDAILRDAKGVLVSISAGRDLTLFEVDEAAGRIREEVDGNAEIIFGASFDESLDDRMRVSLIATGIGRAAGAPLLVDRVA